MSNTHLFELINAGAGLGGWELAMPFILAAWGHALALAAVALAWWRGDPASRAELLPMLGALLLALCVGHLMGWVWPQPRPIALQLGNHYLATDDGSGWPSHHVTVLWSLGMGALASRRHALMGFPLFALGLVVGWCRIYLGANFPFDVLAAFPAALVGTLLASALHRPLEPVFAMVLAAYDRLERSIPWLRHKPKSG